MTLHALVRRCRFAGFLLFAITAMPAGPAAAESVVFDSGLVGVLGGQRARLNVVDVGSAVRAGTCVIQLSFLNDDGQEVAKSEMEVDPGRAASFQHAFERGGLPRAGFLIRGRVTKTGEPCADSELVTTLEVLDGNGKTQVMQSAGGGIRSGPVLATSAVFRAGTTLVCFVANVNQSKTVVVDIEVVDGNGASALLVTQTIAPRAIGGAAHQPAGEVTGYCRFVIRTGNKEDVRASYCVEGETALDCVVTGDAR